MDRLFQNYEGVIEALEGITLSTVISIVEEASQDVVLLWLNTKDEFSWYRIFIDGAYCGIDRYETDESNVDLDEGYIIKDHSNWFSGKSISSASVELVSKPGKHIVLSLRLGKHESSLVCKSSDGECEFSYG